MRPWNRRSRSPGGGRKNSRKLIFVFLLLFFTVFAVFRLGSRGKWMEENVRQLADIIGRQAVWWAAEFWHPSLEEPGRNRIRGMDADPSYAHYIEQKEENREYERLMRLLRENSRLFQNGEKEGAFEEQDADLSLGTVAGASLLEDGTASSSGVRYMAEQLADYDFLMKHFYTVHPTAAAGRDLIRASEFLEMNFALEEEAGPQILIYHTHSREEYADYHQGNEKATIGNVGAYLTELLEAKGYRVIHDTTVYDEKNGTLDRSRAYTYALEGITAILQKYPSIQVVLDLHRDGVKEGTHLVTKVDGKPTATIMFFNGTSETPDGPIEYLPNPYRRENLAFSFQMKLCAEAMYPGYTRNIYLTGLRYNLHLRPRSPLIEGGAQNNTYEEACNAMEPLAELLDTVLR